MQTKEIFSIRTFKTGTHSARIAKLGIALAATAVLGAAGVVSADETSAATEPKTVATEQPLDVTVDNSKAEQAAQDAKSAGVNVVKDQTKDLGTATSAEEVAQKQAQAQQEQAEKAKEITATKEQYLAEKEAVKTENAARDTRNEELKKAADEAKKSYDNANKDIKADQDKVKSEFPDAKIKESTAETKVSDNTSAQAYKDYQKQVEAAQTENKKAVDTYVEEKRKEDKAIADVKAYNEGVRQRNKDGQAAVDAENEKIKKANEEAALWNKKEDERVAKEKAQAEKDKGKNGYLSEVALQGLVFKNETNAHLAVNGADSYVSAEGAKKSFEDLATKLGQAGNGKNHEFVTELPLIGKSVTTNKDRLSSTLELVQPSKTENKNGLSTPFGVVNTKVGKTVTAVWSNFSNATYKGKPISRMELDITVLSSSSNIQDDVTLGISKDPGKGIEIATYTVDPTKDYDLRYKLAPRFYDAAGKLIRFEDDKGNTNSPKALLSISSMNAYKNHVETIKPLDGTRFIPISGSSIVKHANGYYYSNEQDNSNGAHFGLPAQQNLIDHTDSPYFWYLAGALALNGEHPHYEMRVTSWDQLGDRKGEGRYLPSIWFTVTSNIPVPTVGTPKYKEPSPFKTFIPEKEKEVPSSKAELQLVKVTPPADPSFEPHLKDPKTPTVHYNDYKLKVKPTVTPEKHNHDKEGNVIDGASMLPGSINYYTSKWHKAPYKGVNVAGETVKKLHAFIEDYDEDKVEPIFKDFTVTDAEGKKVSGLKMYHVLSGTKLSEELQKAVEASGIKPKGSYIMWVAEDAVAHAAAYNQAGKDIYFHTPMKNKTFVGEYKNQVAQIDYNNGYWSNVVINHIPKLENKKDVVKAVGDTESLNGKEIKLGQTFWYLLDGAKVPANRGEALFEYKTVDDYDQRGDEFTGNVQVLAATDIILKDGTVIKKGTNLTQYTTLTHDKKNGIVTIDFKADFLATVSNKSEFDADTYLEMKRIASGTFENTQKQYINGVEVVSNTVKTTTPEPEKPKTPEKPHEPVRKLPQTGEKASAGLLVAGAAILGLLGLGKFKRKEEGK